MVFFILWGVFIMALLPNTPQKEAERLRSIRSYLDDPRR